MSDGRPLLFYSSWPLGYHNVEAERKALAFARAGYRTVYVAGIGTRNPRPTSVRKLADRVMRKLAAPRGARPAAAGLETAALVVVPPRQLAPLRRLNAAWVERQLRSALPAWSDAVAWIRWPTPELVDALPRLAPAAVVYEAYDANHLTPGITGRWVDVFDRAERELVALADAVVVPTPPLAQRFASWGADVRLIPHGVDLFPWRERAPLTDRRVVAGFVGTLDYRVDLDAVRRAAADHRDWHFRLVGPQQEGFAPGTLADLPNVSVEPAVPHSAIPELLAEMDVGFLPYFDHPHYHHSESVKNLEFLAAGRPVVVRPAPSLERFGDLLYPAETPAEFSAQLARAVAEDTPERAHARRRAAEENRWERRLEEMLAVVEDVLSRGR